MSVRNLLTGIVLSLCVWGGFLPEAMAQDASESAPAADSKQTDGNEAATSDEAADSEEALSTRQESLAIRYQRFEKTLLQMAEYMRQSDPARADLLLRAVGRSKESGINDQMQKIVALLGREQLGDAADRQGELVTELSSLLKLLQSEDRMSEIEAEKERLQALLKDVNRLIGKEKDIRVATDRGRDAKRVAERQADVEKETEDLIQKVDGQDAQRNAQGKPGENGQPKNGEQEGESQEGESQEGESKEGESKEGESKEGESKEGESKQGESQQGKSQQGKSQQGKSQQGESQQGESQQGESQQGESQQGESQEQKTPGREDLEQAREAMQRAIEELKKEAQDEASKHQDEALTELREAKEKLEEILRQLREEERKMMLAALEARFQKMLAMQLMVYNGTVRLDKVDEKERTSRHRDTAIKLARDEDQIVLEADKALALLQEEGSSVAFPEAVQQLRSDMLSVVRALERADVGELTQAIEKDIVEALEEIIESLQREMEKSRQQQQQQGQQGQGQQQDQALVDQLAELKMLRSLQLRVNRRTRVLGRMIDGEQATEPEVVNQLQQLGRRQARIQEATYDLVTGRNQ